MLPTLVLVGRPNVGKSTLFNRLTAWRAALVADYPGLTRDRHYGRGRGGDRPYLVVDTGGFEPGARSGIMRAMAGQTQTAIAEADAVIFLVDGREGVTGEDRTIADLLRRSGRPVLVAAGVRRRGKVTETIEKFSVIKTLQAIADAHVVVLLLDAQEGISEQDAHIAGHILEAGRALVVAVNKWDAADSDARARIKRELERKLGFLSFAELHTISAREGKGIGGLLAAIDRAYAAAMARLPTPKLVRALQAALARQQPPRAGMVRPKLRYAHQGGANPPIIVIHGSALAAIPDTYRRYLEHFFRETFQLQGTPLRIQFKTGANPYAEAATHRRKRR